MFFDVKFPICYSYARQKVFPTTQKIYKKGYEAFFAILTEEER